MRLRIRSIKNISQVTRALQAVSASKVRKAIAALNGTRPYATKAWQVLMHIAGQPGRSSLHQLLQDRPQVKSTPVVVVSDGAGRAYNTNLIRFVTRSFRTPTPVRFMPWAAGRPAAATRRTVIADFSNLPAAPSFADVSTWPPRGGRILAGNADRSTWCTPLHQHGEAGSDIKAVPLRVTVRTSG
jgi:F-type H+-transporting ATPase subunit gamma